ncbi:hypothetical protein [Bacillus alveayuensis]|jgi:hypothetical protein|uniref:hypothetical protein n=1 Tax=Aeribacillus alveayuensis TaxID=279215 RepID=UPI000ADD9467|nr:hypothetical protein [Bacillus alveayuensis]
MGKNKKTKKKESEYHFSWFDAIIEIIANGLMEVIFLLPRLLFKAVKAIMD